MCASGVTRRPGEGNIVAVIDCRANEEENAEYLADGTEGWTGGGNDSEKYEQHCL